MSRKLVFRAVALGCLIVALVNFLPQEDDSRDDGKLRDTPGSQPGQQDVAGKPATTVEIPELLPDDADCLKRRFPNFVTPFERDRLSNSLLEAIDNGNSKRAADLLARGARAAPSSIRGRAKFFPLFRAIRQGNPETVRLLLEHGAEPGRFGGEQIIRSRNQWSQTPLYFAVRFGNREIVEMLLDYGADPAGSSGYGKQPLVAAVEEGNVELYKLLLERGAKFDPGKFGQDRRPPKSRIYEYPDEFFERPFADNAGVVHSSLLELARLSGVEELVREVERQTTGLDQSARVRAEIAVVTDDVEAFRTLVKEGYDVTTYAPEHGRLGSTLLDLAEFHHSPHVYELLSKAGAPRNRRATKLPIHVAIESGDMELLTRMLAEGEQPVSFETPKGEPGFASQSPLLLAVSAARPEMVRFLLKHPEAEEWLRDGKLLLGATPHMRSNSRADVNVLHAICLDLLRAGTRIDAPDVSNVNPDHSAVLRIAAAGWLDAYQLVTQRSPEGLNHHDALQAAAFGGHTEICRFLLQNGANRNASGLRFLNPPIESGLLSRNAELVELLFAAEAIRSWPQQHDVSTGYNHYEDYAHPLYQAALAGDTGFCAQLMDWYQPVDLVQPIQHEPYEYDSDIEYFNKGNTILFAPVFGDHVDTLRVLIALANRKNDDGQPLVDINAMNDGGHTALHEAINFRSSRCVQLLLAAGADPTVRQTAAQGFGGGSAFHVAAHRPWAAHSSERHNVAPEYIFPLLVAAAERLGKRQWIETPDAKGMTPLHVHARVADPQVCRDLLELGADVNAETKRGETPLWFAIAGGRSGYRTPERQQRREEVARMLVEAGANFEGVAPHYAKTYHALAVERGLLKFAEFLDQKTSQRAPQASPKRSE